MSDEKNPIAANPDGMDSVRSLIRRAESGDTSTLPELRKMFRDLAFVELCCGNIAQQAEQLLIRKITGGKNLIHSEALKCKMKLLRTELAGPIPSPLENLLVDRVVACWLHLHYIEFDLVQQEAKMSLAQGEYYQRSRDRAHKRYLSAIRTLALVRKMALPVLQVNIAEKQVNVVGACVTLNNGRTKQPERPAAARYE